MNPVPSDASARCPAKSRDNRRCRLLAFHPPGSHEWGTADGQEKFDPKHNRWLPDAHNRWLPDARADLAPSDAPAETPLTIRDRLIELSGRKPAEPGKGWVIRYSRWGGKRYNYLSGVHYLFTTFRERAYVFGSKSDAAGVVAAYPQEFNATSVELLKVRL